MTRKRILRAARTKAYSLSDAPTAVHDELMAGIDAILEAKSEDATERDGSDGLDLLGLRDG